MAKLSICTLWMRVDAVFTDNYIVFVFVSVKICRKLNKSRGKHVSSLYKIADIFAKSYMDTGDENNVTAWDHYLGCSFKLLIHWKNRMYNCRNYSRHNLITDLV